MGLNTTLTFGAQRIPFPHIKGLRYIPAFITEEEATDLIDTIYSQPWLSDLKRRVQHYGYKYDYTAKTISDDAYLGPLPDWLSALSQRLHSEKIFATLPDQVIINEYLPGQGIAFHRDIVSCFGSVVASLTLGSAAIMRFRNVATEEESEALLEERSLVVMSDDARYEWQHSIPARKSDLVGGVEIPRGTRVSMTFRTVIRD